MTVMHKLYYRVLALCVSLMVALPLAAQSAYTPQWYLESWISYMTSVISENPNMAEAYETRGKYKLFKKDYTGAIADLNKSISLNDGSAWAYCFRGLAYLETNEISKSRKDFERCLVLDKTSDNIPCSQFAYLFLGQTDKATEFMDKLLREDPAGNYYNAACLYSRMGDKDKALDYLRRSLTSMDDANYNNMMIDPDLENIRGTEGFRQILENALSHELNAPKTQAAPAFLSDYIRGYISGKNNCKSVVLSNAGTIAIVNGQISWNRIPDALDAEIRKHSNIIDIVLKSDGSWLVLYDTRKYAYSGNVPAGLINGLDSWSKEGTDVFKSADWDSKGNWVAITDKHYRCAGEFSTEKINANIKQYGQLQTVCLDESGKCQFFCYTNGYNYYGVPPEGLVEKLDSLDYHPRKIVVWQTKYFFASEDGSKYWYSM